MKFLRKHDDHPRAGEQQPVVVWSYDNEEEDDCEREFGAVTVYGSGGYYRAGDSYDGLYTRWYRDASRVRSAAEQRARQLAKGGKVEEEEAL